MSKIRKHCPFCFEKLGSVGSRENISIDTYNNSYKCYRCGSYGFLTKELALQFGIPFRKFTSYDNKKEVVVQKLARLTSFKNISPLYKYMIDRGISDHVLNKFNVSLCIDGSMRGVVFPLLDNKDNSFIYRNFNGDYINNNIDRNKDIYNGRILNKVDAFFVVEGPIDALRLYPLPAVATLGKGITEQQLDRILYGDKKVIFALDSDAMNYTIAYAFQSLVKGKNVYYVYLSEGKDPADYGYENFLDLYVYSLEGGHGKVGKFFR